MIEIFKIYKETDYYDYAYKKWKLEYFYQILPAMYFTNGIKDVDTSQLKGILLYYNMGL